MRCDNCGTKFKLLPYLKMKTIDGGVEFDKSLYEVLLIEQDHVKDLVQSNKYVFNEKCNLYFKESNSKIHLCEGNLIQDKTSFTFMSDDGFRMDFDMVESSGFSFKLNEGLYLQNDNMDYVLQLFDEAQLIKINFALKEYQQINEMQ